MNFTAIGVIIVAALALFILGAAGISLSGSAGGRLAALVALVPASLVLAMVAASLLGYRLPAAELGLVLPVGVGLLTTVLARSPGYGLLAGLVVAVTMF